ncbi:hypothetical protein [Cytobacillus oceanisediminis]|uniref:hypothetical protein n=1 Tax=Cytobacillus oceanisediminis TaxID=665099 RepID=UPI0037350452
MRCFLDNERGSGVLLTISNFAIVGIMLILILNIAMAFTKKEQASIAAEHASLAATSVLYEQVYEDVKSYKKLIDADIEEGTIDILKTIEEKVEEREDKLKYSQPFLSKNERRIQAIDDVLSSEIKEDHLFSDQVLQAVRNAESYIDSSVQKTIGKNHGNDAASEYKWEFQEYRIVVEAETRFEAVHYNGLNFGKDSDVSQVGTGPEISFLEALGW